MAVKALGGLGAAGQRGGGLEKGGSVVAASPPLTKHSPVTLV